LKHQFALKILLKLFQSRGQGLNLVQVRELCDLSKTSEFSNIE